MIIELLAAIALTASPGCPKTKPGEAPPVSMNPDWQVKPDYRDIYWAFPPRAVAEHVEGRATIECAVSIQGAPENCNVVKEDPVGYGFGAAAVTLTSKMLFKPKVHCGTVVPGEVTIPLAFKLPETSPAFSSAPLDPKDKKLAMAVRLVLATHLLDAFQEMFDDGALLLAYETDEDGDEVSPEERKVLHDAALETWAGVKVKVLNSMARSYASHLSDDELAKAVGFYEGPVGAKLIDLDDTFSSEIGKTIEALQPDMILEFHRRYCEKLPAKCVPDDAV